MQNDKFQKIEITTPVYLHEQGQFRPYSEDYIFPITKEDFIVFQQALEINNRVFVVCDGVGGSAKGDMASQTVCKHFSRIAIEKSNYRTSEESVFYSISNQEKVLTNVLSLTEQELDKLTTANPEWQGLSTTLTYLNFTSQGAVVAWVGDSRIYQIRNNGSEARIVNMTDDHSLVNELYKRGDITAEERETHPRRNVILRAISGTHKSTKIDVQLWDDIKPGDYFLMCTDGILDGFKSENELITLIANNTQSLEDKKRIIQETCHINSKDNYSMYLMKVEGTKEGLLSNKPEEALTTIATKKTNTIRNNKSVKSNKWMPFVAVPLLLLIAFLAWKFISKVDTPTNEKETPRQEIKKEQNSKKRTNSREKKIENKEATTQQAKGTTPIENSNKDWRAEFSNIKNIGKPMIFKVKKNEYWSIVKRDTTKNITLIIIPDSLGFSEIAEIHQYKEKDIVRVKKGNDFGYVIILENNFTLLKEKNNKDFNIYKDAPVTLGNGPCPKYTKVKKKGNDIFGMIILSKENQFAYTSEKNAKENCK